MKKTNRNLIKIKTKDLKTKLYSGNRSRFIPAKDYKTNIALLHRCRYCKASKFSKELSVYDGKLIYICPECGGRHKYSMAKVNFQKALKLICLLLLVFCLLVIFAGAADISIPDMFPENGSSQSEYLTLEADNNYNELDSETYKEFLFVAPKDGYYKFNSLSTCEPEDVRGELIINGEVVCENDNFAETSSFYMLRYLEKGQEVILAVDAHDKPMAQFDVQVKKLSDSYAKGVEIYIDASENGYEVSSSKDVYFEPSFYADSTNYNESATRYAESFYIEDDESYVWLAFGASNSSGEEFQVWYPINLKD